MFKKLLIKMWYADREDACTLGSSLHSPTANLLATPRNDQNEQLATDDKQFAKILDEDTQCTDTDIGGDIRITVLSLAFLDDRVDAMMQTQMHSLLPFQHPCDLVPSWRGLVHHVKPTDLIERAAAQHTEVTSRKYLWKTLGKSHTTSFLQLRLGGSSYSTSVILYCYLASLLTLQLIYFILLKMLSLLFWLQEQFFNIWRSVDHTRCILNICARFTHHDECWGFTFAGKWLRTHKRNTEDCKADSCRCLLCPVVQHGHFRKFTSLHW